MKTKEEIFMEYFGIYDAYCLTKDQWDNVLKCMDEYAKQQSIAFGSFALETDDYDSFSLNGLYDEFLSKR